MELKEEDSRKNEINNMNHSMWLRSSGMGAGPMKMHDEIFDYDAQEDQQAPGDILRRSTRQRSLGYMNFDLENSRAPPNLSSLFAHSMIKTNSKGLFSELKEKEKEKSLINPKIKITSSFD